MPTPSKRRIALGRGLADLLAPRSAALRAITRAPGVPLRAAAQPTHLAVITFGSGTYYPC